MRERNTMSRYNTIRLTVLNCGDEEAKQLLNKAEIVARWIKLEDVSEFAPLAENEPRECPSSVVHIMDWMHNIQQSKLPVDPPEPPKNASVTVVDHYYAKLSANERIRSTHKSHLRTLSEIIGTLRNRLTQTPSQRKTIADFGLPGRIASEGVSEVVAIPLEKILDDATAEKLKAVEIDTVQKLAEFVDKGGDLADAGLDQATKAEVIYTVEAEKSL